MRRYVLLSPVEFTPVMRRHAIRAIQCPSRPYKDYLLRRPCRLMLTRPRYA